MVDETKTVWKAHRWMEVKLKLCGKLTHGWGLNYNCVESSQVDGL